MTFEPIEIDDVIKRESTGKEKETRKGEKQPVKGRVVGDAVKESGDQSFMALYPLCF